MNNFIKNIKANIDEVKKEWWLEPFMNPSCLIPPKTRWDSAINEGLQKSFHSQFPQHIPGENPMFNISLEDWRITIL